MSQSYFGSHYVWIEVLSRELKLLKALFLSIFHMMANKVPKYLTAAVTTRFQSPYGSESSRSKFARTERCTYAHMTNTLSYKLSTTHTQTHTPSINLCPPVWALWASPPFLTPTLTQGLLYQGGRRGTAGMEKGKKLAPKAPAARCVFACAPPSSSVDPWCCNWGVLSWNGLSAESLKGANETMMPQTEKPFLGEAAALWPLREVETPGHWQSGIKFNTTVERRGKWREGKKGGEGKNRNGKK